MFKIILLALGFSSVFSWSQEVQESPKALLGQVFQKRPLKVRSYDTKIISLKRNWYIERLAFEAKKCVGTSEQHVKLSVDGDYYSTVTVGANSYRSYIVDIERYGDHIEVKSFFTKGCVKIRNVRVLRRKFTHPGGRVPIKIGSDAYYEISYLKDLVQYLYHVVPSSDRIDYLDPLLVASTEACSVLETTSDLAPIARQAVEKVVSELNRASSFIEKLIRTPDQTETGREMLSIKRILEKMLRS